MSIDTVGELKASLERFDDDDALLVGLWIESQGDCELVHLNLARDTVDPEGHGTCILDILGVYK